IEVMTADTPTGRLRARVALPAASTLLLSEPFYPERRAWVDGVATPIEKSDVALSSIAVPAGTHVVELAFVPTSLYWGAGISLITMACWILGANRRAGRRR